MLKLNLRSWLIAACLSLGGITPGSAQTPASTNAPSTNAPTATPAIKSFAIGDVVAQAQAALTSLKDLQTGLDPDQTLQEVQEELPKIGDKINLRVAGDERQAGAATLSTLQASQMEWQSLADQLDSAQTSLSARVQTLDDRLGQLNGMDAIWKGTLKDATDAKAPADITKRITEVLSGVSIATKTIKDHQNPLYTMQNRVAAQDARTKSGLDAMSKAIDAARQELFQQNRPALWNPDAFDRAAAGLVVQEKASLQEQSAEVATYLKAKTGAVLINMVVFLLLIIGFFWIRNSVKALAEKEPALQDATHIFAVPFANALLIALLTTSWLYPNDPRLLWAAFGAIALIPAVIITRRLIDSDSFPILYATMIAFLVDQVRYVITPAGVLSRMLFILELMAVSIFVLSALRFKHLALSCPEQTRLKRFTRIYLHLAFLVFVFAGLANVFGYIKLSVLVGDAMLSSSYLAVILYAAVRILDALAISALSIRPLSALGMVRRHKELLYANTTTVIRWLIFAVWLIATLLFFTVLDLIYQQGHDFLWTPYPIWFSLKFSVGALLAFPITVWASFLVSRFIRFLLEEEVYPHMSLARGIPYAASTMVHYTVLVIGFFLAVAATGADLSQFAFLAGAFGVGLGFGLQNIMNNFVSGVILLFERPIKVGDSIQIDATTVGTVERIGIRASVILLTNGAELIVPNGNLISNPVTNWTLSNCERLIEIPVTVTSAADPQRVLTILNEVAHAHHNVIRNPAPEALLITIAGTTLTFRLRAWIDAEDKWMQVTSDLSLAIRDALAKENIAMA
jgi:potassium-dependent mechanosensitive channel